MTRINNKCEYCAEEIQTSWVSDTFCSDECRELNEADEQEFLEANK